MQSNIFRKTFADFKNIRTANPTLVYGYEDFVLENNSTHTDQRLIIMKRNENQIYHIEIYKPSEEWNEFESEFKAGSQ